MNIYALSVNLGSFLLLKNMRLAVAESCTGGGLAQILTEIAGSSLWFERGFVTYSNAAKVELLQVQQSTLEKYGAVSEQTAREMALGTLRNSHADMALSITGIAGPSGGTSDKPVGLVWFGYADQNGVCEAQSQNFNSGRHHIRVSAIDFALRYLITYANKK